MIKVFGDSGPISGTRQIIGFLFFLLVAAIVVFLIMYPSYDKNKNTKVTSFTECEQAGFPVMESYPRQCRDSFGNNFIEEIIDKKP